MTLDARPHGLRPGEQLCIGAVTPFRSQRARNVHQGMSAGLEFSEAHDPITWVTGTGLSAAVRASSASSRCLWVTVCVRRSSTIARADCTDEEDGVRNPGEHMRAKQWAVDDVLARLSERDEMTGEVSTIDRGHVFRVERAEVTRVIPVIEMTTETLEAVHRAERGFEPLDCGHGAEPAEIVRGDGGEEIQPEVGGRRAVGHDRCRLFLKIVGRKGVVLGADKGLEESPGPARG